VQKYTRQNYLYGLYIEQSGSLINRLLKVMAVGPDMPLREVVVLRETVEALMELHRRGEVFADGGGESTGGVEKLEGLKRDLERRRMG
jgi:hypothetical protein